MVWLKRIALAVGLLAGGFVGTGLYRMAEHLYADHLLVDQARQELEAAIVKKLQEAGQVQPEAGQGQ